MSTKRILLHGVFSEDRLKSLVRDGVKEVYVLEGRPHLTAVKQNCSILQNLDITPTVMADNMTGYLFSNQQVDEVWVAYRQRDRKGLMAEIGALIVAILAKTHHVPVFAVPGVAKGPVFGKAKDIQSFNGRAVVPGRVKAFVPLCEWVPAKHMEKIYE